MKKIILYTFLLLLTQFALGQNAIVPSLKVHLADAETGQNISKARVTLEGFEIKAIKGKYNEQGKYYYFTEIPKDYTTIMVYHKNYNEKGYQNPGGLPKEIKFKMYKPYRVRIAGDTLNHYKEDKNKKVIQFTQKFEDSILWKTSSDTLSLKTYFNKHYPELILKQKHNYDLNFRRFCYVTKKNGKDFKRFNDPLLYKLSNDKNIYSIDALLLKTKVINPYTKNTTEFFTTDGKPNYIPKHIAYSLYDTINKFPNYKQKTKWKGTNMTRSYRDKYFRGLLHKNVYTLNQNELDSLYKLREKYYQKEFYDYQEHNDTVYDTNPNHDWDNMPNGGINTIPYRTISNIIEQKTLNKPKKDDKTLFSFTYRFVTPEEEKRDLFSGYNLDIIEKGWPHTFCKFKHLICSPFGLADVLEITPDTQYEYVQIGVNQIYKN
ncbi:hypothetical protein [Flavobacterium terrisoli]|uniref:hypothetical protein n=1 Tax=Flavobacterium terrisoli TaxID=3242195 RepID=UPI00254297E9|nr:hypothetical protein [Flavobacterium buctense]